VAGGLVSDVALAAGGGPHSPGRERFRPLMEALLSPVEAYSADVEPLWGRPATRPAASGARSRRSAAAWAPERSGWPGITCEPPHPCASCPGRTRRAQLEAGVGARGAVSSGAAVTDKPLLHTARRGLSSGHGFSTGGYPNTQWLRPQSTPCLAVAAARLSLRGVTRTGSSSILSSAPLL